MDLERLKIKEGTEAQAKSPIVPVVTAVVVGIVLGLLIGRATAPKHEPEEIVATPAVTQSVKASQPEAFTAGGWVEVATPQYPIVISSRISQRLDALMVTEGQAVKSGDTIARLYDGEAKDRLQKARARAREKEEELKFAKSTYDRAMKLEKSMISEQEIDRAKARYATAGEARDVALADLALAEKELSFCTVEVPANLPSLRVLDIHNHPGDWIALDKNAAIVSLYDPGSVQVRIDVPQSKIRFVSSGQPVEIRTEANPEREYSGRVVRVEPLATLSKNTITVRISIQDPDELLFPEMVAHATFLKDDSTEPGVSE